MKRQVFLRLSLPFMLAILLFGTLSPNVFAEDESNPNDSVYDWVKEDEHDKETKKVIEEDEPAANRSEDGAAVRLSAWDYVKTLAALLFVVGLLFALLKFINRKNRAYDQHRLMKNVGGLSLGQHKSIQLVIIGESYYLVGVGDEVRLLKEITDSDEISILESYFEDELNQPSNGVVAKLLSSLPAMKGKTPNDSGGDESSNFGKVFSARLDELKAERKKQLNRLENKKDE